MSRYRIIVLAAVLFAGIIAAAFLLNRPGSLPQTEPFLIGSITQIQDRRVLIEASPDQPSGDKCWFAVVNNTQLVRGGEKIALTDLKLGLRVKAWNQGPVLESYPCQTGAQVIAVQP